MEAIRAAARRRQADAVRDLLRHRARDRVRARLPAARRAADPRLRRRSRRPRPVLHVDASAPWARRCRRCAPATARDQRRPRRPTSASSSRSCARKPMAARAYDDARPLAQGHDHAARALGPDARHRLHPAAARRCCRSRVRAALDGDGALLARMIRDSSALDVLGSPRDFSTARYATVCETDADALGPRARRSTSAPAVVAAADRARCRRPRSRRSTPPVVVEDEIDLCLRWPDVPRPPSTRRAAAVSDRADADPPGRRGPAHAAGGAPRAWRRGSRARSGSSSRASGTRPSATRATARARRSTASSPASRCPKSPASGSRPASRAVLAAPTSFDSLARRRAACRARSGARAARSARRSTTSRSSLSPARWRTSGGGLRGGSLGDRAAAGSCLKRLPGGHGVTRDAAGGDARR